MDSVGALATFFMIWWVVIFAVLPWGVRHPEQLEKGMMPGAPLKPNFKKIFLINTGITFMIWLIIYLLATFDVISFQRMADEFAQQLYRDGRL